MEIFWYRELWARKECKTEKETTLFTAIACILHDETVLSPFWKAQTPTTKIRCALDVRNLLQKLHFTLKDQLIIILHVSTSVHSSAIYFLYFISFKLHSGIHFAVTKSLKIYCFAQLIWFFKVNPRNSRLARWSSRFLSFTLEYLRCWDITACSFKEGATRWVCATKTDKYTMDIILRV